VISLTLRHQLRGLLDRRPLEKIRKFRKRMTLSGYVQQILFQIIMKYIHKEVARENS